MRLDKNKKILIVGLGLIGGSYAEALTAQGFEVGAVARRGETIEYALDHGLIAHGTTEPDKEYLGRFDLIVFGLYPKQLLEWLDKYQSFFKENALITDVAGVKGSIVYKVQEMLRSDIEFIGAHPMAGKEVSGVENATAKIFRGANYIVTPTDKNTNEAIETCRELGEILGFARISVLSPEKHDEMIGFLSQLTHCIAVALMNCKESGHLVDYTGDSFRDLTRIAKINEAMWSELFLMNKRELLEQMDIFAEKFEQLRDCLEKEDVEGMKEMMRISTVRRTAFDR